MAQRTRPLPVRPCAALAALLLAWPAVAAGQDINIQMKLQLKEGANDYRDMSAEELGEFFNVARCECDAVVGLELRLVDPPFVVPAEKVQIWAGTSCDDASDLEERDQRCEEIHAEIDLEDLRNPLTIDLGALDVMFPNEPVCERREVSPTIWALVDEDGDDNPEWSFQTEDLDVDTELPPEPANVTAQGGENAAVVSWELPETNAADIRSFQILCAYADTGEPVFDDPPADAAYLTVAAVCGEAPTPPAVDAGLVDRPDAGITVLDAGPDAAPVDAAPVDAPAPRPDAGPTHGSFDELDPRFVCTGEIGGTSSKARVNLQGATGEIVLKLVVIDDHRNATEVPIDEAVSAQPVKDFWEVYGEEGGQAQGGFCGIGAGPDRGSRLALGVLALLAAPAVVLLWRRRHGGRRGGGRGAAAAAAIAALLGTALARPAEAQLLIEEDRDPFARQLSPWIVELKFGPYLPGIDDELAADPGPYERTFGDGASLLSQLEVDRFFLWPAGQLGVAVSVGHLQNTADAFVQNEDGTTRFDERSEADETAFTLIPTSVSAVYRFTKLADETYVPLVPYGKLGLAYYVWWITKGDGSVASTETGGTARGGTLGWQGSLGLSARLDRLDPGAARNLSSELGVEHAGLFAEITYADVAGLGMANRLNVGDLTWSAGLNFEF